MARINIENSLWTRGEWLDLVAKTGSADTAIGSLVRVWMVSQRHWFPGRKPIPLAVWKRERLNDAVIECGLAEKQSDGIYVRGSEEQFAWLFDKSEAGKAGGLKSAEVRKGKLGTAQPGAKPRKRRSSAEAARSSAEAAPKQPEASLLSSPSSSLSTLNSNSLLSSDVVDVPEKELAKEGTKESVKNPITRFERQFSADREKFKECFKYFVERSGDERLRSFATSQKLNEAIRAFEKPEECWSWLENLADSIFDNKPDSPLNYASASWRREISERLSDVGGVL